MRKKQKTAPAAQQQPQEPKNPVFSLAKQVLHLLQNKLVASILLFAQGILFLVSPSGDLTGTIRISAGLVILACAGIIIFHLKKGKGKLADRIICVINGLVILAAIFFLFRPDIIEPHVRIITGVITVVMSVINLIGTLKIKNKKDWKFIVSVAGAAALAGLGVFMLLADEAGIAVFQQSIGAILILNALANIWYLVQQRRHEKEAGKAAKAAG
jgi:uncharacterized membrane protein HdeD (DUF308 family)